MSGALVAVMPGALEMPMPSRPVVRPSLPRVRWCGPLVAGNAGWC